MASTESPDTTLRLQLLARLARRRKWLVAVGLQAASYGVQGVALVYGPIALVAPLSGTDLLFALPLMARRANLPLGAGEWLGAACVVAGVGVFLGVSPPTAGITEPRFDRWLIVFVIAGAAVVIAVALARQRRGKVRAALLAIAGAVTFAIVAALTKSFVESLASERFQTLLTWVPYGLLAAGVIGAVLLQSAFQAGELAVSLPIIDTVEPIGSVLIGATVFEEHLAATQLRLAIQLLGAAIAVVGVILVDRSQLALQAGR